MILKIFSIYDNETKGYFQPISYGHVVAATRWFKDVCEDKTSVVNKFPNMFELRELGEMNMENGTITAYEPRLVMKAVDMLPKPLQAVQS